MTIGYRPKGGRRSEDFPVARARDAAVLAQLVGRPDGMTRNLIAVLIDERPRLVTRSLYRLADRGLVEHVPVGCEGHGFWKVIDHG